MLHDRFQREFGTTRRESASAQWTKENGLGRRQDSAVEPDCKNQDVLGRIQGFFSSLARRMALKKSRSTSASPLRTMDGVATNTIVTGENKSC